MILTDVLADLLARPAVLSSSDQHVTGYSRCDLQSLLAQLPYSLLHDIMDIPVAQHCWHYFGQHLFPICAQMFVSMARDYMRKSERALTACPLSEATLTPGLPAWHAVYCIAVHRSAIRTCFRISQVCCGPECMPKRLLAQANYRVNATINA